MAQRFTNKTAVVTGAGVGIGYTICHALAREGAMVALNDIDPQLAQQSAAKINAEVGAQRVVGFAADIGDVSAIRAMIESVAARLGGVDICVANAGITLFGKFLEYEPDSFDRVMAVNLRGTFFTAQAAARVMIERQVTGRIVLMSSVTGIQAVPGLSAYGATKAGICLAVKTLGLELGQYGITVNAVAPGATVTERTRQETAHYEQDWAAVIPTRRAGTVDDVAAAVLFLASEDARQITGDTIVVDGGWTASSPIPPGY